MKESQLEAKFTATIRKHGGRSIKWTAPGTSGVPDRLAFLPAGLLLIAEIKKPGGVLSPLQEVMIDTLRALGFWVEVIDSIEKLNEIEQQINLLK
jgi:hypothetical protein